MKNGETINGTLVNCDSWMNLTLSDVIQSFNDGESFHKLKEIYIRGNHIKYLRMNESIMDRAKEQNAINLEQRNRNQKRRTGYGGGHYGGGNRRNFNRNSGQYNNQGGRRYNNNNNYNNNNYQGHNNHSGSSFQQAQGSQIQETI